MEALPRGDEVSGVAVHTSARIGALADRGQVLVSQTVRDLVAGSGIDLAELGARQLRGVEGEWRVSEAQSCKQADLVHAFLGAIRQAFDAMDTTSHLF